MELSPGTWAITVIDGPWKDRSRRVEVNSLVETRIEPATW